MEFNSVNKQRSQWSSVAGGKLEDGKLYSYGWGDPEDVEAKNVPGMVLGNYRKIKDEFLVPNIKGKTVLDIGCFDGKWTNYMGDAGRVICADLDPKGFEEIKSRLAWSTLEFYHCNGYLLDGIPDASVDFVFSMDSLVRSEWDVISSYIKEIARVLAPSGKVCVHLPAQDQHLSWELGFTQIGSRDILNICESVGLGNPRADTTVNHGILLMNF